MTSLKLHGKKFATILFLATVISCMYWLIANLTNVYAIALLGVVFELIWLPMVAAVFLLPTACVFLWVKEKCTVKSYNLYSILIQAFTFIWLSIYNN